MCTCYDLPILQTKDEDDLKLKRLLFIGLRSHFLGLYFSVRFASKILTCTTFSNPNCMFRNKSQLMCLTH